jgi:hypothetical protein
MHAFVSCSRPRQVTKRTDKKTIIKVSLLEITISETLISRLGGSCMDVDICAHDFGLTTPSLTSCLCQPPCNPRSNSRRPLYKVGRNNLLIHRTFSIRCGSRADPGSQSFLPIRDTISAWACTRSRLSEYEVQLHQSLPVTFGISVPQRLRSKIAVTEFGHRPRQLAQTCKPLWPSSPSESLQLYPVACWSGLAIYSRDRTNGNVAGCQERKRGYFSEKRIGAPKDETSPGSCASGRVGSCGFLHERKFAEDDASQPSISPNRGRRC